MLLFFFFHNNKAISDEECKQDPQSSLNLVKSDKITGGETFNFFHCLWVDILQSVIYFSNYKAFVSVASCAFLRDEGIEIYVLNWEINQSCGFKCKSQSSSCHFLYSQSTSKSDANQFRQNVVYRCAPERVGKDIIYVYGKDSILFFENANFTSCFTEIGGMFGYFLSFNMSTLNFNRYINCSQTAAWSSALESYHHGQYFSIQNCDFILCSTNGPFILLESTNSSSNNSIIHTAFISCNWSINDYIYTRGVGKIHLSGVRAYDCNQGECKDIVGSIEVVNQQDPINSVISPELPCDCIDWFYSLNSSISVSTETSLSDTSLTSHSSPKEEPDSSKEESTTSSWKIVLVVVAVAAGILFVIFFIILFRRSNRNNGSLNQDEMNQLNDNYLKE